MNKPVILCNGICREEMIEGEPYRVISPNCPLHGICSQHISGMSSYHENGSPRTAGHYACPRKEA